MAGGAKFFKGRIEFIRFRRNGDIDRRIFAYKPNAISNAPNNPILASGDLIRIRDSVVSQTVNILNEVTDPFIGLYSVFSLFEWQEK